MGAGEYVILIFLGIISLVIAKLLIGWYHEIPKRNRLLEEILTELKKMNKSEDLK